MGLINYEEYKKLGYCAVSENEFDVFSKMAESAVLRYTFGRVDENSLSEDNKIGICEIIEIFYFTKKPDEAGENKVLASFKNEGYSESYIKNGQISGGETLERKIGRMINTFFDTGQRYRGVEDGRL